MAYGMKEAVRMRYGKRYTILFSAAVCGFFAILVTGSAVLLKDRQEQNQRLDRIKNILQVAGLVDVDRDLSREQMLKVYEQNIEPLLVDLGTGEAVTGLDPDSWDSRAAVNDKALSVSAPPNRAGIVRVPKTALVFMLKSRGEQSGGGTDHPGENDAGISGLLLPIEGKGLWSTLYGYIALEADLNTIRGITYYQHGETPGLGGEVENPRWKNGFHGKKLFDRAGRMAFKVVKGRAGDDPFKVDGISGATTTSNGVTHMIDFWMGENGFGPFLKRIGNGKGRAADEE